MINVPSRGTRAPTPIGWRHSPPAPCDQWQGELSPELWRHVQSSEGREERSNRHSGEVTRRVLTITGWDKGHWSHRHQPWLSSCTGKRLVVLYVLMWSKKTSNVSLRLILSCSLCLKEAYTNVNVQFLFLKKYCQLMSFIDILLQWYKDIDYLGVAKTFCLFKNKWHTICPNCGTD